MNTKSFKQPRRQSLIREIWDFTGPGFRSARKRFEAQSWSTDKHIVLTGATSGLGLSAAKTLAAAGATLTLVVRDEKKGGALKLECETLGAAGCQVIVADMALLVDARHVIDVLLEQNIPIDVLINNAGALFNTRAETAEGLEQSTSLLLLSPIMLMQGLKPLLQASKSARVVNVVSGGMYTQRLSMSWLRSGFAHRYDGPAVYAQAKRALAIVTEEWHQEWAKHGVYLNTTHPGWADTPGVQTALPTFRRWTQWILRSPDEGADTIVWMAVSSELDRVSGCLFLDRQARRYYLNKKTQERPTDRRALLSYINEYVSF